MSTVIESIAELNELPVGSVILTKTAAGSAEKHPDGHSWWFAGSHIAYRVDTVPLPSILLFRPDSAEDLFWQDHYNQDLTNHAR